jgi:ferredoxin-nitrite reductase
MTQIAGSIVARNRKFELALPAALTVSFYQHMVTGLVAEGSFRGFPGGPRRRLKKRKGRRGGCRLRPGSNAVEAAKASLGGDGLRIRGDLEGIIGRGHEAMTAAEKDLLKWVGVFFRKPTPGRFMMRIRMPNGFSSSAQLRTIADLSRRLGNSVIDITTRQQIELRGFTIGSVPEIWERLRGVNLHSLQTGMDNVRNINGCPLAGLTPYELLDASPVVMELDRRMVGTDGNPEFTNLPRKMNITVTGCLENCTHSESQDIALVPAISDGRLGFNVLVGGKMGSGGFTVASPLNVFVEPGDAANVVLELVRIYRDHGPRDARSKCRLAFLVEEWGLPRLRAELVARLRHNPAPAGTDLRQSRHNDHLGITQQQQLRRVAVGLSVTLGRVDPRQLSEIADLADGYGDGTLRFTTGQNVIIPNVPQERLDDLQQEPLLEEFSITPSPFQRGLVACVGTDFCNLAQIETKQRAKELSEALEQRLGNEQAPVRMYWSGCPAGCGNHQAADIGLRGLRTNVGGRIIEAVAIYAGGRTGPHAVAGTEVLATVPCDASLPDVVANLIKARETQRGIVAGRESVLPEGPASAMNSISASGLPE